MPLINVCLVELIFLSSKGRALSKKSVNKAIVFWIGRRSLESVRTSSECSLSLISKKIRFSKGYEI